MNMKAIEEQHSDSGELSLQSGAESHEVDLLELLIVLAERKWLIAKVTAGITVLATAIVFLIPNHYTATATIMPPQQTQSTSAMLLSQLAGSGLGSLASLAGKDIGLKNPNDLYVGMLTSRTVQDAIIAKFNFQQVYREKRLSDARKELQKATDIVTGKDGLIDITFEDKDPRRAADVANTYVEELRKLTQHLAVTEASQRRLFFEQQVTQAKDDLATAEVALKETQQQTGMIQLDSQAKAILEAVGRLRAQIAAKEVELQAMHSFATDQNPQIVLAEQQLAALRLQLGKLEKQPPSDANDPFVATAKVPAVALEYVRRLREVKYREAVFELLAKQFEAAKLDEAKQAAVIQVVDVAIQPDKKSWPKRGLIVLITAILGILGVGGYVLVARALSTNLSAHSRWKVDKLISNLQLSKSDRS